MWPRTKKKKKYGMGCSSNMTPSQTLLPVSIEIEEKSGDLSTSCYTDCASQICYTDGRHWDICCWGFSLPPVLVTSGYWKIFSPHFEKYLRLYFSTNKKPWSVFNPTCCHSKLLSHWNLICTLLIHYCQLENTAFGHNYATKLPK